MTPAARISAAIELLDEFLASLESRGQPADALVNSYFRTRRYAGSKDKRAIREIFYGVLRSWERRRKWLHDAGSDITGRALVLTWLGDAGDKPDALFGTDHPHAPAALTSEEQQLLQAVPVAVGEEIESNLPGWAIESFKVRFGDKWQEAAQAMSGRAPLAIRINTLKSNAKTISRQLDKAGAEYNVGAMAPDCINIHSPLQLTTQPIYRNGEIEVQDEAAQIGSLLVDACPGMKVLDLCAGAGGKSLAIACQMQNEGSVLACDTSARRLVELGKRSARSGVTIIKSKALPLDTGERRQKLSGKTFDRVVLDVPCGGSGTWRRSPDLRLRNAMQGKYAAEIQALQASLLEEGKDLVAPGGRLVYMTCSLLPEENENRIEGFLQGNPDWKLLNWQDIWQTVASGSMVPESFGMRPELLQLSPHAGGTDGFFVAVLARSDTNNWPELQA